MQIEGDVVTFDQVYSESKIDSQLIDSNQYIFNYRNKNGTTSKVNKL